MTVPLMVRFNKAVAGVREDGVMNSPRSVDYAIVSRWLRFKPGSRV